MTETIVSKMIRFTFRLMFAWMYRPADSTWTKQRKRADLLARMAPLPRGVTIDQFDLSGVPAERLQPKNAASDSAILYLYGGGYVVGSARNARSMTTRLAISSGLNTFVPEYRLAPQYPFPAAADDALQAYKGLLALGYRAERIAVVGDSVGAALAMHIAMSARDTGMPAPSVLGLICPLVDMTPDSSAFSANGSREPLLTRRIFQSYVDSCGAADMRDPRLSPIYADLTGLPAIVIQVAGDDLLAGDGRRFAEAVVNAGGRIKYTELANRWHIFHFAAGVWRDARNALESFATDVMTQVEGPLEEPRTCE
jgi:monoterpene epsilon-lactone hydrolase